MRSSRPPKLEQLQAILAKRESDVPPPQEESQLDKSKSNASEESPESAHNHSNRQAQLQFDGSSFGGRVGKDQDGFQSCSSCNQVIANIGVPGSRHQLPTIPHKTVILLTESEQADNKDGASSADSASAKRFAAGYNSVEVQQFTGHKGSLIPSCMLQLL